MSTFDDENPLEFFEEPETLESPERQRRRMRPQRRSGGPRRPAPPPPGAVALARLAGFVALAIAVVVGLVFWVGSCQGQSTRDEYKSYMDQIQPIAQSSAATGTAALVKAATAPKQTLAGLQAKLEQWASQQQQDYDEAVRLVPPAPLQAAHQEVLATIQLRAIGLTGLADVLGQAGSKPDTVVANLLANQAQILNASDLVWAELFRLPATQAMKRAGIVGVIAPPSQLVSNPEVISSTAFKTVYDSLHATTPSGTVKGLRGSQLLSTEAVAGSSSTPLSTASPTTVKVSSNLTFKVTFRDAGNFVETHVPVTLTVNVFNKQVLPHPLTKTVSAVQSQQTATVTFGNLQLPSTVFGAQATVNVSIGKVPGEKNVDNNKASYLVFFSLPSGG